MPTYKAGKGAQYTDDQAQVIGQVLESLGDKFEPQAVVEAARPKRSPIHDLFDWDDSEAAELWRKSQARNIVNHLEIVVVTEDGRTTTKAFHSVTVQIEEAPTRNYASITAIRKDSGLSQQVVNRALRELNAWKLRYSDYQRIFGPVFAAIDKANKKVKREKVPA